MISRDFSILSTGATDLSPFSTGGREQDERHTTSPSTLGLKRMHGRQGHSGDNFHELVVRGGDGGL